MTTEVVSKPVEAPASRLRSLGLTEKIVKIVAIILLIGGSIVFALPFYTAVSMSLKSPAELASTSSWSLPKEPTLSNYNEVLFHSNSINFFQVFVNTTIITVLATLGVVISSSLVAYAFARLRFRGRDRLFVIMLSTMMLPPIVTLIPSYLLFARLHWVNTFLPLIIPAWFGGGAFNIFLLRQFFMSIPRELDEAAILDGAGHFTIWRKLIMPLSKTALATVGALSFIYTWRDFMSPLIYLNDNAKQTLELGLATYNGVQQEKYHLLMAGSVLLMIPLVVIFFVGQRYFVRGITMSGIK